jgi:hypothetical protein
MYMRDFDLRELELQLYGFDAGLAAAGSIGDFDRFNRAFSDFLIATTKLSCSRGWATAILEKYGRSESTFREFVALTRNNTKFARSEPLSRRSSDEGKR